MNILAKSELTLYVNHELRKRIIEYIHYLFAAKAGEYKGYLITDLKVKESTINGGYIIKIKSVKINKI